MVRQINKCLQRERWYCSFILISYACYVRHYTQNLQLLKINVAIYTDTNDRLNAPSFEKVSFMDLPGDLNQLRSNLSEKWKSLECKQRKSRELKFISSSDERLWFSNFWYFQFYLGRQSTSLWKINQILSVESLLITLFIAPSILLIIIIIPHFHLCTM